MVVCSAYDNEGFCKTETEVEKGREDETHTFDEAINLAGNGRYNMALLATMSIAIISMSLDMFGFSVIVSGATCDFELDHGKKSILLSMPFCGPIFMAYPWGYISDTQGRRKSLLIALTVSYTLSTISAFSPNWVVLAVLRFFSTSFCSCAQSATYTLLGESCPTRVKGAYMLVITSVQNFGFATYMTTAFGILNLDFLYDLGYLSFAPWRFLGIVLALPAGISAVFLYFLYESPKFLLNAGEEVQALEVVRKIWEWNRNDGVYPVKKLVLNEEGNAARSKVPLVVSLWQQTAPLFKPPLLFRTLQLFYLTSVIYSINNALYSWFPFLAESIIKNLGSESEGGPVGLCAMITTITANETDEVIPEVSLDECVTGIDSTTAIVSLVTGLFTIILNLIIAKFSTRKKSFSIAIFLVAVLVGIVTPSISNNLLAFIFYLGLSLVGNVIGILSVFFVELYPTSYRGMAACLGVMVARLSALAGVNIIGTYITTHCEITFYVCSAYILSGALVSLLLPADRPKTN